MTELEKKIPKDICSEKVNFINHRLETIYPFYPADKNNVRRKEFLQSSDMDSFQRDFMLRVLNSVQRICDIIMAVLILKLLLG